jgi:hypothetical protein
MLRVADCIADGVRLAVPQRTEWQRVGNQINAAVVLARADFVNMSLKGLLMANSEGYSNRPPLSVDLMFNKK